MNDTCSTLDYDCLDVMVDQCPPINEADVVIELPSESLKQCQYLCDEPYEAKCKSFIYSTTLKSCSLLRTSHEDYVYNCTLVGAAYDTPKNCLLDDATYPNLCKVF